MARGRAGVFFHGDEGGFLARPRCCRVGRATGILALLEPQVGALG